MNYNYIKYKVFRLDGGASFTTNKRKYDELNELKKKFELTKKKKRSG